jgi:ADP-L-glycero-D-manno-heptose 6-epimerase
MDHNPAIIVTGAAGFIGSCMVGYLNRQGYSNIVIVDDFSEFEKKPNYIDKKIVASVERDVLFDWLVGHPIKVDFIFHLGARTDTTEFDYSIHEKLNVQYSKEVWAYCAQNSIPLIYASSAATYGRGELGYKDDHDLVEKLKPLNPYGISKNEFDKWALSMSQESEELTMDTEPRTLNSELRTPGSAPPFWAGLKFFNVYGPNEYHKGRMASVVFHAFNQIKETGQVKLFRSHKQGYKDGEQLRDFIYSQDVVKIMFWMMETIGHGQWTTAMNGIYNVGTGRARTFNDLANAIFASLNLKPQIEYIDTPPDIRDKYQYFTQAEMSKLQKTGYDEKLFSLEEGVENYVTNFLLQHKYY